MTMTFRHLSGALRDRTIVAVAVWAVIAALSMAVAVEQPQASQYRTSTKTGTDAVSCVRPKTFDAVRRCGGR
ncbi:MAG: hypothetical protein AAF919_12980 [Pseudomonadota bacterium]